MIYGWVPILCTVYTVVFVFQPLAKFTVQCILVIETFYVIIIFAFGWGWFLRDEPCSEALTWTLAKRTGFYLMKCNSLYRTQKFLQNREIFFSIHVWFILIFYMQRYLLWTVKSWLDPRCGLIASDFLQEWRKDVFFQGCLP
jgi:hypothetical protein